MPQMLRYRDNGAPYAWVQKLLHQNIRHYRMITNDGNLKTFWRLHTGNQSHPPGNCLQQISPIHSSLYQKKHHTESFDPFSLGDSSEKYH
jgi:hypothetical protein